MSEQPRSRRLVRQVQQHLDAVAASGIEFVNPTPPPSTSTAPTELESVAPPSLFAELEPPITVVTKTPDERRQALTVLADKVRACTTCTELAVSRTQIVFGVGPLEPDLCFIGEAPGADEDRQGEPFVGAAGQLLNKIIAAMGLRREDVYICNMLRCRPPGNRQPTPVECNNCRPFLDEQLELVKPKFLCALGATAANNLLRSKAGINRLRGQFHTYNGIPVICTFHPAALLPSRSPQLKKDVWEDMKTLLRRMGRPIPGPGGQTRA
jgi:DNA polymerase